MPSSKIFYLVEIVSKILVVVVVFISLCISCKSQQLEKSWGLSMLLWAIGGLGELV